MRIGMRLLLGYFLLVAVAAWFVLAIFVKEVKPGVRRATEGTLIDTATLLAELARPDLLSGDPTHGQLAQALGNLLDNAIDFTPESGCITLSAEVDQEHVTLKVLDTGSGIPDYALSRIFERFYSLPRANGQKSSGLGLAFVSEVARLFNGEVTLRNVQEGGVLASLRLHRHFT